MYLDNGNNMNYKINQCQHFGFCGGCAFRDTGYLEQLVNKKKALVEEFRGMGAVVIEDVLPSPAVDYYRNRMDFVFGSSDGKIILGQKQKGRFDRVVDINSCYMMSSLAGEILNFSRKYFRKNPLPVYDTRRHEGVLRYLVLREGKNTGDFLVNLVTAEVSEKSVSDFATEIKKEFSGISTFVWSVSESFSDDSHGDLRKVLFGDGYISDKIGNTAFRISPYSFFQTNTRAAELLYAYMEKIAGSLTKNGGMLFDLYCGAGGFGLVLAGMFKNVVGVELYLKALEDARINCNVNDIVNYQFINAKVEKIISVLRFGEKDIIILDPPRAGVQAKAARKIVESKMKNIVYVSCNPRSLRIDLEILAEGFDIGNIQPFDMFPHTPHVECVVALKRKTCRGGF